MMVKNDIGKYLIFNPCGEISKNTRPLSTRKNRLSGQRLGILDNSKWNANKLLRGSARELSEMIEFSEINYYVKPHGFSNDAPEQLLNQIAEENDIVLTAIGDCGSCCSCCIRDAVSLEERGIPSAAIITNEFVTETRLTREAIGMPDLRPIVIKHPVSSVTDQEVNERVQIIKVQAPEVWLGQRADI